MYKILISLSFLYLSQPAFAQEREWLLDTAEEDVYLLFGVPNTADVGVSFWCKISTGEVSLFTPLPISRTPPQSISVAIGSKRFDFKTEPNEDDNTKTVEAKLVPQDAVLAELKTAERFSLTIEKHNAVYPLEGADFAGLMKLCAVKPEVPSN